MEAISFSTTSLNSSSDPWMMMGALEMEIPGSRDQG